MRLTTVALAMILAACSGGNGTIVDSAAGEVAGADVQGAFVIGLDEWMVDSPIDTLPAGRYAFRVENSGTETHGLEIAGNGRDWKTGDLEPGSASELVVDLTPGTYELYCPEESRGQDHQNQGMKRKLVVRAS